MNNKKIFGMPIVALAIAVLVLGLGTAALMTYFGTVEQTTTVQQGLTVDGNNWDDPVETTLTNVYSNAGGIVTSKHKLINNAGVDSKVTLVRKSCSGAGSCDEIETTFRGTELIVTQDSNKSQENKALNRPYIEWTINGNNVDVTFANPSAHQFVFDYRLDNQQGSKHEWSDLIIKEGELKDELFGDKYNWVSVSAGTTQTITLTPSEELWLGLRVGAEQNWYLDWIKLEYTELTQPITVPANNEVGFMVSNKFPVGVYPGNYVITSEVDLN